MPERGARTVFVYLLNFMTLYLSAVGVVLLVWGLADRWFEDPLNPYTGAGSIRPGISMVVVAFPIFIAMNSHIRRRTSAGELPERSGVKSGLTYLTLFVIALSVIIDLITLIYSFLGGELTARFSVKSLGLLAVVSFVFVYYLQDLRDPAKPPRHSGPDGPARQAAA